MLLNGTITPKAESLGVAVLDVFATCRVVAHRRAPRLADGPLPLTHFLPPSVPIADHDRTHRIRIYSSELCSKRAVHRKSFPPATPCDHRLDTCGKSRNRSLRHLTIVAGLQAAHSRADGGVVAVAFRP